MSETHWFEAYRACPCGCGYDGDFLIDDATGYAVAWRCNITGESGGCAPPPDHDAGEDMHERDEKTETNG